jgi:hypothetical protein
MPGTLRSGFRVVLQGAEAVAHVASFRNDLAVEVADLPYI